MWWFALLSLLAFAAADDPNNAFYFPTALNIGDGYINNMVFSVGKPMVLNWTTTWQGLYWMELWQQNIGQDSANNISVIYSTPSAPGAQTFSWIVSPDGVDLSYSNVFYIVIDGPPHAIGTWYFNMTTAAIAATTTAQPATSSTTAQGTTTQGTSTQAATSQTTTAQTSTTLSAGTSPTSASTSSTKGASAVSTSSNAATSTGASISLSNVNGTSEASTQPSSSDATSKVGLGVGLGIGIPLVAILAVLAFILAKRRKQHGYAAPPSEDAVWQKGATATAYPVYETEGSSPYSELPAYNEPKELPASYVHK